MKKQKLYKLSCLMLGTLIGVPASVKAQVNEVDALKSHPSVIERLDGGITSEENFVGAISDISTDKLKKYPELTVTNALQGKAAGLIVRSGDGGVGYNSSSLFVRGLHSNGGNQAIVIIDGIERPLDDILAEEIETIEVLKDAAAKVLYGSAAANGVINITTKRGAIGQRIVRASVEAGVMNVTRKPEYLNSYDYAKLYNEARVNDGLSVFYQPEQLDGYKNSTGANDLLYPDVDYMDMFARSQSFYRKATVEFMGGSKSVKYSLVAGYTGSNGLEKVGKRSDLNRFNLRGNLDIRLTDYLVVKAGVGGRMELKNWGNKDGKGVYTAISNHRPNEYPLTISPEDIGLPIPEDGIPYFGTNERFAENLYADTMYGGETSERYVSSQADLGLDFDFNKHVKGLTASAYLTFDNYNSTRQAFPDVYPTYDIRTYNDEQGNQQIQFTQKRKVSLTRDNANITDNVLRRTSGWRANIGYETTLGSHHLSAVLAYRYFKNEQKGMNQDAIDANYSLRMNYGYDNRYMAEVNLAYMGSNRFMEDNKYFFSPTFGAAWILSNEKFMKSFSNVNFFKLKASFGVLGYAGNTSYNLFRTAWTQGGTTAFAEQNNEKYYLTSLVRYGNPNLKWEKSAELNVGIEGSFFHNRLRGEVNYFHEDRSDIIGTMGTSYASYIGPYTISENIGKVTNQGFDAYVSWSDAPLRDFSYEIGVNMTYSKNKLVAWDENSNIEDYRKKIGQSTDRIMGLRAEGLFGKDVPLAGHAFQTFGPYQNGDIAYTDLNKDGVVDSNDETHLGHTFPRIAWGIDADLKYKNWELYVQGVAETGVSTMMSNTYYWNKGLDKYSTMVLDRYHETENPQGTYPRLTTTDGANSFRNSSYWVENTSFFRLKNIELSYTFKFKKKSRFAENIKLFARGANLFVLSKVKDLDPERPNAGVTNYPVLATYTGGISITF